MPRFRKLIRYLWQWKAQPTADPSPVDAIVRLLRETDQQHGSRGDGDFRG